MGGHCEGVHRTARRKFSLAQVYRNSFSYGGKSFHLILTTSEKLINFFPLPLPPCAQSSSDNLKTEIVSRRQIGCSINFFLSSSILSQFSLLPPEVHVFTMMRVSLRELALNMAKISVTYLLSWSAPPLGVNRIHQALNSKKAESLEESLNFYFSIFICIYLVTVVTQFTALPMTVCSDEVLYKLRHSKASRSLVVRCYDDIGSEWRGFK